MFKLPLKSNQLFGLLALLGISFAFFRFAIAIVAFTPQAQPTGYIAQPDLTNYNLTSGNETVFVPDYEREFWSGNLHAYPVNAQGGIELSAPRWGEGARVPIEAQNWNTGRLIATMLDDGTGAGIPFRYTSLSTTQKSYFPVTTISLFGATGQQIVDFLRGDRTNEGPEAMRIRNYVLGDIVHSRPYYVADPVDPNNPTNPTYPTVFVGSNDGMLHAINANDGSDRWAYVPSMLLPKMINLAKPYGGVSNPHDYFVDGQINIGSIDVSGTPRRILVGMLGAGGKGIYALNIEGSSGLTATTETGVAGKVMWEINGATGKVNHAAPTTANAYDNLGFTYGIPALVQVRTSAMTTADAVIVGNGYNDNSGGDYQAYLYVINALNGQLIAKIQAGTTATAASPNGLSTAAPIDTDGDGVIDRVYAGDLNGNVWKFDLTANAPGSWTSTLVYTTSPAQPITGMPGVAVHPNGGYMVNFGTGSIFTDVTLDTSTYYAYGVWDGSSGSTIITQTLQERNYSPDAGVTTIRVRRVANAVTPNWTTDKGWKVALPAGERVVGEGTFIENGRFYFNSNNPTKFINTPDPCVLPSCANQTQVYGENWLMELDYLSGGTQNDPFLDLDGNLLLDNSDRLKYELADLPVVPNVVGSPITTTNGIPVGKYIGYGATSQPVLVQLRTLNTTLFAQNPDIVFPYNDIGFGVTGGHFDIDIFYGAPICGSTTSGAVRATATITVGSAGSSLPVTLGGITVDGVSISNSLSQTDMPDGTSTTTNATAIKNKINALGTSFTATAGGSNVTVSAPAGTAYNGQTFAFLNGTSNPGLPAIPGVRPTGLIVFAGGTTQNTTSTVRINNSLSGSKSVTVGTTTASSSNIGNIGGNKTPSQVASYVASAIGTGGSIQAYVGGNSVTPVCQAQPATKVCLVDTTNYTNGNTVSVGTLTRFGTVTVTAVATAGATSGTAATGWNDLAPYLNGTVFSGGTDGTITYNVCGYKKHVHQYDDKYDKTGLNMLNASDAGFNLSNGIGSTATRFRVIAQNQYLNPAVKVHVGDSSYLYNVDHGYISIKDFVTSSTLDVATLPVYDRTTIGSLAFNMPVDALSAKDWSGTGDVRSGLIPIKPQCAWNSAGTGDSNLYRPVMPPANGTDGPGVLGASGNGWAGVRHGGALTFQLIKEATPNSAIEENVTGRPEYGWRVKKEFFDTYVLTEYITYWHHPNNLCYNNSGWVKAAPPDNSSSSPSPPAAGSTDPKIGDLSGGGGTVTDVTRTVVGNVTTYTITYQNGSQATISRTANSDGSVRIITCDALGTCQTQDIAASKGTILVGGDERGLQVKTGRVSWHELITE
ncbi:MAG: hypothetical protein FD121_897 [Gallionellaceae bacterium]|nr:MAG: hypothetical protein FD121_897 [Gallionellaceae bacterium]